MPLGSISCDVRRKVFDTFVEYDQLMYKVELHSVMTLMDQFIRYANKYWTDGIKAAEDAQDSDARRQVLIDSFYLLRVATLLMHPVVPASTERICDYLSFEFDDFFSWNYDFDSCEELCSAGEISEGKHRIRELPPRFDFFAKHPCQRK